MNEAFIEKIYYTTGRHDGLSRSHGPATLAPSYEMATGKQCNGNQKAITFGEQIAFNLLAENNERTQRINEMACRKQ
jgi:hypothetical protein